MARKKVNLTSNIVTFLLPLVPFVVFGYFVTRGINLPYVGYNAWNYNAYSQIAENYNRFGFINTKFAPILSVSETFPERPEYYLHHPPFLPIVMSMFYKIFGSGFWVGRLPVILASIGTLILFYFIGNALKGKKYGLLCLAIASVVPASSIFGRMIGQESFVLFFVLLSTYALLQFVKTKKKTYLYVLFGSIILGTMSDWPMTYFTVSLVPFLLVKKQKDLAILLVATSTFTAVLFLIYTFFIVGSFAELAQAFFVRSTGELLQLSYWPFRWLGVIVLRVILYFNPFFVLLSVYYLIQTLKPSKEKSVIAERWLLFGLLFFGLIHIMLYPEGSFGHAYWIYYLLPFFVFASSWVVLQIVAKKQILAITILLLFSISFIYVIERWKTNEVKANLFRYSIASAISKHIPPYSVLLLRPDGVVDIDFLLYWFNFKTKEVFASEIGKYTGKNYAYFYSCLASCGQTEDLRKLQSEYTYVAISDPEAQAYLFFLNENSHDVDFKNQTHNNRSDSSMREVNNSASRESILRYFYRNIKDFLHAPQI